MSKFSSLRALLCNNFQMYSGQRCSTLLHPLSKQVARGPVLCAPQFLVLVPWRLFSSLA